MALDYDIYENVLWVAADNGYNNRAAKITFNGTADADIVHVNAPSGIDIAANNEGFAIAEYTYTKDGQRPVYRFLDGVTSGALSVGNLSCDYTVDDDSSDDTTGDGKDDATDDTTIEDGKGDASDDTTGGDKIDSDKGTTKSPKTGDTAPILNFVICACASFIVILGVVFRKRILR